MLGHAARVGQIPGPGSQGTAPSHRIPLVGRGVSLSSLTCMPVACVSLLPRTLSTRPEDDSACALLVCVSVEVDTCTRTHAHVGVRALRLLRAVRVRPPTRPGALRISLLLPSPPTLRNTRCLMCVRETFVRAADTWRCHAGLGCRGSGSGWLTRRGVSQVAERYASELDKEILVSVESCPHPKPQTLKPDTVSLTRRWRYKPKCVRDVSVGKEAPRTWVGIGDGPRGATGN